MYQADKLEPKSVFHFFEEICRIPHGSGNVEKISNYLVDFAKERNLYCVQDSLYNVVIIKEATAGYEEEEPVILQGHMDMVAVSDPGLTKDMRTEGLDLDIDGDYLFAVGTSLGGDDGIAVAYALALLDSSSISHPRLEVLLTVDEEVGMDGARGIDLSMCKGTRLLNLDSEEEGILLTSCAGGARIYGNVPVERQVFQGISYNVLLEGLQGGHSGAEIDKERGNANCLMGRFLHFASKTADIRPVTMAGGTADNAISGRNEAVICISADDEDVFIEAVAAYDRIIKNELAVKDPGVKLIINGRTEGSYSVLTKESADRVALLLFLMPGGVQAMSADIKGLVQTSLNLGICCLDEDALKLDYSVRSSVCSEKEMLLDKVALFIASQNGTTRVSGDYPAWEYRKDSVLRDKMVRVYEKMYGELPQIQAIHAGLECGILAGKIAGLDCVSFGPDMKDIHTTQEKLSISSVNRVWEYLLEVLKTKD